MTRNPENPDLCVAMPDFERLQFYYGRTLTVADLQTQQSHFLEKLRLHTRCFVGMGIVCGLGVVPVPTTPECTSDDDKRRAEVERELRRVKARLAEIEQDTSADAEREKLAAELESLEREYERWRCDSRHRKPPAVCVTVECGWAVDCEGREIIVRSTQTLDVRSLLSCEDRRAVEKAECGEGTTRPVVELTICYCEQQTYPTRPIVQDNCDLPQQCRYGRVREAFRFCASLKHQPPDSRCSACCEPCESDCVVLAHIVWPVRDPLGTNDIDWRPRRPLSLYRPAVIDGISWAHGATYDSDRAKAVLGTEQRGITRTTGLEVHFSRPVYAETLQPGVVDLWRVQGGRGLAGVISQIEGRYVDKPKSGLIDSFRYCDESGETLNQGDRVLIQIRANFILDKCCRPVDGEHVGGLTPQLAPYRNAPAPGSVPPRPSCADRALPWTSGNGWPGGTFESWFYID